MSTSSRMTIIPSWLMSSSRPTNGDRSDAPAFAARRPWLAVKISVQLVLMPSSAKPADRLEALLAHRDLDDDVRGELREVRGPRVSIPSTSSATTSAETGPGVIVQISWRTSS